MAAATFKGVGALARVTVQGELGILLWNTGRHREAYTTWSAAAQELLAARRDTREWKTLFRLFGNCTGYFLSGLRGTPAKDAEVTVPFAGILLRDSTDIDQLHDPRQDWLLPVQMTLLAESVGAYGEAVDWASRTKVGSGALGAGAQSLLAGVLTADDLAEHRCAEIIRAADLDDLDEAHDTEGFAHLDESVRAQRAVRFAARLNLIALAIELARVGLNDKSSVEILAKTAAERARECADRHGGSRVWTGTAEVLDALRNRGVSFTRLRSAWEFGYRMTCSAGWTVTAVDCNARGGFAQVPLAADLTIHLVSLPVSPGAMAGRVVRTPLSTVPRVMHTRYVRPNTPDNSARRR